MAWEFILFDIPSMLAGADMSGTNGGTTEGYQSTAQFLFAKLSAADTVVPCAALTDAAIGVIQTNPKAGSGYSNVGVEVRQLGVSKVVAAAALAVGTFVGADANARAVARVLTASGGDAGHWVNGVILEATNNAGELATMLLMSPFILQS